MPYEGQPHPQRRSPDIFGLTEREQHDYRLSATRFFNLLNDPKTTVHQVHLDHNSFGEYLFVSLSRVVDGQHYGLTCYGLGFHEQRERWLTEVWYWYENHPIDSRYHQTIPKTEALRLIQERQAEIASSENPALSDRALLFALLADLTDEDGALTELDDLDMDWHFDEEAH